MTKNIFDERFLQILKNPYCINDIYNLMHEYNFDFGYLELVENDRFKALDEHRIASKYLNTQPILILKPKPKFNNHNIYINIDLHFSLFDRPMIYDKNRFYHHCLFQCQGFVYDKNFSNTHNMFLYELIDCQNLDLQDKLQTCLDICNLSALHLRDKDNDDLKFILENYYQNFQNNLLEGLRRKNEYWSLNFDNDLYTKVKKYYNIIY